MRTSLKSQKMFLVIFKSICIKYSPELKKYFSHPVTSKQSPKIVQILKNHHAMHISVGLMIPILENMADCYSIYNFCSSTEFACQEDSHCNEKGSCNTAPRTCQCDDGWTQFFDCTFGKFQIYR